jgi:hypothetical protein
MAPKTRKPTGRAGWPRILVEGGDKAGKSWSLAELSASPKVGQTRILVLGEDESRWDEYGLIPGARFEIALHDGTWSSVIEAVKDAKDAAAQAQAAGEKPFVFGFDTMTAEWDGHKDWATFRARNSTKNRALLEKDPNAEIDVSTNYWNDARARHRHLMRLLLLFPGIVVLTARGGEVTKFKDGKPVANQTTWSVEGEKNLAFDVSTHIRMSRDFRPQLISAAGVHCILRPGIDRPKPLPDDKPLLEHVIFDMLKLDASTAAVGGFAEYRQELTPEQIRDEVVKPETTLKRIQELWPVVNRSFPAVEVDGEPLLNTLKREGDKRLAAEKQQRQQAPRRDVQAAQPETPAGAAVAAGVSLADLGDWALMIDEITRPEDEEQAAARVAAAVESGELDEVKAGAITRAIKAKVAAVTRAAAA